MVGFRSVRATVNRITGKARTPAGAGGLALAALAALLSAAPAAAPRGAAAQGAAVVMTAEGPVAGVRGAEATAWKGLPYAAPPVGALRWRAPRPAAKRDAVLDASAAGPACPQIDRPLLQPDAASRKGEEDCLTLNVWAPNSLAAPAPVMVWLHGGGFIQGSGGETLYDGARLAAAQGVVVVTLNYRLGALGFLVHPAFVGEHPDHPTAGNWGLLDQLAALRWVRANIAAFGGDPARVTIFGESAGGVSVCSLLASPLAAGLVMGAIMQSGGCEPALRDVAAAAGGVKPAVDQGRRFAEAIGCGDAADAAACLRAQSVDAVLAALPGEIGVLQPGAETYGPVRDGYVLAEPPAAAVAAGRALGVPWMVGANADEGTVFLSPQQRAMTAAQYEAAVRVVFGKSADQVLALYPAGDFGSPGLALAAVTGDAGFVCPARRMARAHAARGRPAWLYHFTYVSAVGRQLGLGAFHGSEIPLVFGAGAGGAGMPAARALGEAMQAAWGAFARSGDPATVGLAWPRHVAGGDVGLRWDTPPAVVTGWRKAQCDLWDAVVGPGNGGPGDGAGGGVYLPVVRRDAGGR